MYHFIQDNLSDFGLRWLLKRFNLSANAYYNYLKDRKHTYHEQKQQTLNAIETTYHTKGGTPGYRMMQILLKQKGIKRSKRTIHKYMKELGLRSIVMRRKPKYIKGRQHKIFENQLKRDFTAKKPNQKWCTDFTYINLSNGQKRYNCSILDLYDRSIVASLNSKSIDAQLAINTLQLALKKHKVKEGLLLHSDQGSQFASKEFSDFCKKNKVTQSMSKAGCPYDNAPMERFYNTLKNEYLNHYSFKDDQMLMQGLNEYIFCWYNYVRPHTYNGGIPPAKARSR